MGHKLSCVHNVYYHMVGYSNTVFKCVALYWQCSHDTPISTDNFIIKMSYWQCAKEIKAKMTDDERRILRENEHVRNKFREGKFGEATDDLERDGIIPPHRVRELRSTFDKHHVPRRVNRAVAFASATSSGY